MKLFCLFLLLATGVRGLYADLTIVQKVEGTGQISEMTTKIKGTKARIEMGPQMTSIIDGTSGEVMTLLHDQKSVLRISSEQAKAAAEMARKFAGVKDETERAKLTPTGKKEKVSGYDTQEYTSETPNYSATYWIATNYPNGPGILKQLQDVLPKAWGNVNTGMPDYKDLPGLPLKSVVNTKQPKMTSTITITAVKQDPINDSEFNVPAEYKEMKMPDIFSGGGGTKTETKLPAGPDSKPPVNPNGKPPALPGAAVTPSATP